MSLEQVTLQDKILPLIEIDQVHFVNNWLPSGSLILSLKFLNLFLLKCILFPIEL